MQNQYPIADLYVFPVQRLDGRWKLLADSDHLLRRFGQLEFISLKEKQAISFDPNEEADDIYFTLRGAVRAVLSDLRKESPSYKIDYEIGLNANKPQGLLIPFGVAHSFSTSVGADLLKVSTHQQALFQTGSA